MTIKSLDDKVAFSLKSVYLWYNRKVKELTEIEYEMKEILKQFRPFDFILIGLALLLSFTPPLVTNLVYQQTSEDESQLVAIVKINGLQVDELPLGEGQAKEITYHPNEGQYNIVEVKGDAIRVREDNSPDQIAVNTGWISKPGQVLICLPHQLIIEIVEKGKPSNPDGNEPDDELILPL